VSTAPAERVALQESQMRLLAPLPLRNALKIVDVPADELGDRRRTLLDARERGRILEGDLTVPGPAEGRRSMRKGAALTVKDDATSPDANDRGVARGSVGLLANFDCGHGAARGDMTFLSPLRLPGKR